MAAEPLPQMFPSRNRIISGLSRGVDRGRSVGTQRLADHGPHAGDQGRDVFAVPGPVDSPASADA